MTRHLENALWRECYQQDKISWRQGETRSCAKLLIAGRLFFISLWCQKRTISEINQATIDRWMKTFSQKKKWNNSKIRFFFKKLIFKDQKVKGPVKINRLPRLGFVKRICRKHSSPPLSFFWKKIFFAPWKTVTVSIVFWKKRPSPIFYVKKELFPP